MNALVVGVSADSAEVQMRFVEKYGLTFPMIPDTEKRVIAVYGARNVLGVSAKRSTFLIDPEGSIARVWANVKLEGHADDVVETIRSLAGAVA